MTMSHSIVEAKSLLLKGGMSEFGKMNENKVLVI